MLLLTPYQPHHMMRYTGCFFARWWCTSWGGDRMHRNRRRLFRENGRLTGYLVTPRNSKVVMLSFMGWLCPSAVQRNIDLFGLPKHWCNKKKPISWVFGWFGHTDCANVSGKSHKKLLTVFSGLVWVRYVLLIIPGSKRSSSQDYRNRWQNTAL